ncbi:MAG TPA: glycosyltransferase family 39 protein [Flavobacteriales bacterium]|nr:glycosyltransferase family 39 protein [Flavobacteriales bacterium]
MLALLWGVVLRFHAIQAWKVHLSHDESISYLCAATTEGLYQETIQEYTDSLITVGSIQAFYTPPAQLQYRTVAADLAGYDIHPPLFFWALHTGMVYTGFSPKLGPWINAITGLLLLLLTFLLAREALGSTGRALVACAIWYLSPSVVQIDLEARQYQFIALWAMASYLLSWRIAERGTNGLRVAGFTVVNALGMLSHYYFVFVLVPGLWLMWRRHGFKSPLWIYLGSLLASVVLFLAAFPEFFSFLSAFPGRPKPAVPYPGLKDNLVTVWLYSLDFFGGTHALRHLYRLVAVLAMAWIGWALLSKRLPVRMEHRSLAGFLRVALVWCAGFTVLLYFVHISPPGAVGEQYFSYFWPLLAITLVPLAEKLIPRRAWAPVLVLYVAQLAWSFTVSVRDSEFLQPALPASWYAEMGQGDLVVTDGWARGYLPKVMMHLPAETPLFLMRKERPDVAVCNKALYLHPAISPHDPGGFATWMSQQGFVAGEARKYDNHQYEHYRFQVFHR